MSTLRIHTWFEGAGHLRHASPIRNIYLYKKFRELTLGGVIVQLSLCIFIHLILFVLIVLIIIFVFVVFVIFVIFILIILFIFIILFLFFLVLLMPCMLIVVPGGYWCSCNPLVRSAQP